MTLKAVILAGGRGTRMGNLTDKTPKPMLKAGGKPLLRHIIEHYRSHGVTEFIICAGYKQAVIRDYFKGYRDVEVVATGEDTATGGRLKRVASYVQGEPYFLMTYGDTLSDVDVRGSIGCHLAVKCYATMTIGPPDSRMMVVHTKDGRHITQIHRYPWVNRGFYVLSEEIFAYLHDDMTIFEEALRDVVRLNQLVAYRHEGWFHSCDTPHDLARLDEYLRSRNGQGIAPGRASENNAHPR